jgi:ribosomal protein S18 acetylase RimI-like enzyme
VYLHVWAANDEAKRFYGRFGFEEGPEIPNYYRGIDPPHGVVLRKVVAKGGGDAVAAATPAAGQS